MQRVYQVINFSGLQIFLVAGLVGFATAQSFSLPPAPVAPTSNAQCKSIIDQHQQIADRIRGTTVDPRDFCRGTSVRWTSCMNEAFSDRYKIWQRATDIMSRGNKMASICHAEVRMSANRDKLIAVRGPRSGPGLSRSVAPVGDRALGHVAQLATPYGAHIRANGVSPTFKRLHQGISVVTRANANMGMLGRIVKASPTARSIHLVGIAEQVSRRVIDHNMKQFERQLAAFKANPTLLATRARMAASQAEVAAGFERLTATPDTAQLSDGDETLVTLQQLRDAQRHAGYQEYASRGGASSNAMARAAEQRRAAAAAQQRRQAARDAQLQQQAYARDVARRNAAARAARLRRANNPYVPRTVTPNLDPLGMNNTLLREAQRMYTITRPSSRSSAGAGRQGCYSSSNNSCGNDTERVGGFD